MATKLIDDTILQNIAEAIQEKDGGNKMRISEMAERISAIESQNNMTLANSMINRTITNIESDVSSIGNSAFSKCTKLTSAIFTEATTINILSFEGCTRLTNIEIPKVTSLGVSSFYDCERLSRIFLPATTYLNSQSFEACDALTVVVMGRRCTLGNTNVFLGTDNAIIYVQPGDLSWYGTATNWGTLRANNRIKSVAELTDDDLTWYQQQLAKYPLS